MYIGGETNNGDYNDGLAFGFGSCFQLQPTSTGYQGIAGIAEIATHNHVPGYPQRKPEVCFRCYETMNGIPTSP